MNYKSIYVIYLSNSKKLSPEGVSMLAVLPVEDKKRISLEKIKKYLEENHLGYLLLTCSDPSQEGFMEIQFSSQGEETLLLYLLELAKERLDSSSNQDLNFC